MKMKPIFRLYNSWKYKRFALSVCGTLNPKQTEEASSTQKYKIYQRKPLAENLQIFNFWVFS